MAVIDIIIIRMNYWFIEWLLLLSRKNSDPHQLTFYLTYQYIMNYISIWHSIWPIKNWHSLWHASGSRRAPLRALAIGFGGVLQCRGRERGRGRRGGKRRKATESDGKRGGEGVVHLLKSRDPHVAGGEKWNLHYPVWKKGCSGDLTPGTAVMKVQSIYLFPQFQRPG